jgi:hypothetical protein
MLPHIVFAVVAGLGCSIESAQRRFLKIALTLMGVGAGLRPFADALLHALVAMEADRGTMGPAIRDVLDRLDADVCGGRLCALALRLLRAPGVPAKLWAIQFVAQTWDAAIHLERAAAAAAAGPEGSPAAADAAAAVWAPGPPDVFVAAVASALTEGELTLTLLTLDLLQLLVQPAFVPPGPHASALCAAVLPLLGAKVRALEDEAGPRLTLCRTRLW